MEYRGIEYTLHKTATQWEWTVWAPDTIPITGARASLSSADIAAQRAIRRWRAERPKEETEVHAPETARHQR